VDGTVVDDSSATRAAEPRRPQTFVAESPGLMATPRPGASTSGSAQATPPFAASLRDMSAVVHTAPGGMPKLTLTAAAAPDAAHAYGGQGSGQAGFTTGGVLDGGVAHRAAHGLQPRSLGRDDDRSHAIFGATPPIQRNPPGLFGGDGVRSGGGGGAPSVSGGEGGAHAHINAQARYSYPHQPQQSHPQQQHYQYPTVGDSRDDVGSHGYTSDVRRHPHAGARGSGGRSGSGSGGIALGRGVAWPDRGTIPTGVPSGRPSHLGPHGGATRRFGTAPPQGQPTGHGHRMHIAGDGGGGGGGGGAGGGAGVGGTPQHGADRGGVDSGRHVAFASNPAQGSLAGRLFVPHSSSTPAGGAGVAVAGGVGGVGVAGLPVGAVGGHHHALVSSRSGMPPPPVDMHLDEAGADNATPRSSVSADSFALMHGQAGQAQGQSPGVRLRPQGTSVSHAWKVAGDGGYTAPVPEEGVGDEGVGDGTAGVKNSPHDTQHGPTALYEHGSLEAPAQQHSLQQHQQHQHESGHAFQRHTQSSPARNAVRQIGGDSTHDSTHEVNPEDVAAHVGRAEPAIGVTPASPTPKHSTTTSRERLGFVSPVSAVGRTMLDATDTSGVSTGELFVTTSGRHDETDSLTSGCSWLEDVRSLICADDCLGAQNRTDVWVCS